jgi:two-component sensor histidine kinase
MRVDGAGALVMKAVENAIGMAGVRRRPEERRVALRTLYVLAVAALAALVPLILFAGLWLRSELAQSQRDMETYLVDRVRTLSQQMDAQMRQQFSLLTAISALPSLDGPDAASFQADASRLVADGPRWRALTLVEVASGGIIVGAPETAGAAPPLTPSPEAVREVAASRRPAVRAFPSDGGEAEPQIALYVPVVRGDAAAYVLVAAVRASAVQDVLMAAATPDLLTVVIDGSGRILARSRGLDLTGQQANEDLRGSIDARPAGIFAATTLDGQQVFTGFQRSPLTGWVSVAAMDRGRYAALANRSTFATLAAGLLSLTLAAVLAIVLSYNVVQKRVNQERLAASRALSDLDARLLAATQDALAEQRKAATEREVLLREIYHRVKNNLQIVQSLLRLGARDLLPEQQEPFEAAVRRIGAMARVHTLLYNSPDLASVDLRDYLDDLVQEVASSYGAAERGIDVVLDAESMRVPLDTAVPLAFIAVELLTNAFRHAFPDDRRGTVTVRSRTERGRGVLEISDDGIGIPEARPGRRSLGLTIVTKLARQIEGELEMPSPGESLTRIAFPLEAKPAPPLPGVVRSATA